VSTDAQKKAWAAIAKATGEMFPRSRATIRAALEAVRAELDAENGEGPGGAPNGPKPRPQLPSSLSPLPGIALRTSGVRGSVGRELRDAWPTNERQIGTSSSRLSLSWEQSCFTIVERPGFR
jgi:hypothetical protein